MSPIQNSELVTRTGEVAGAQYIISLRVGTDGDTRIEAIVAVVGGRELRAPGSGSVFDSEEAAMTEAIKTVEGLAESDELRSDVAGVKPTGGHLAGR
ncbi:hypothetical protein [Stenotrophomonas sp.]|uniref:hypothetical protein n=1 Tax=Stenotrophomonas sp. TaxID=69392 RepID=UPI00289EFEFF|nr:hypothetical protein [Stenotrophomonas sp.]